MNLTTCGYIRKLGNINFKLYAKLEFFNAQIFSPSPRIGDVIRSEPPSPNNRGKLNVLGWNPTRRNGRPGTRRPVDNNGGRAKSVSSNRLKKHINIPWLAYIPHLMFLIWFSWRLNAVAYGPIARITSASLTVTINQKNPGRPCMN